MNNDSRYWDKNLITEFLEAYKNRPCLWNIKCPDYTNKPKKKSAYEDLVQLCKKVNMDVDKFVVKSKIQALRASFRKELRKVELSIRNGGKIYRPRLWYFDLLMFTSDQDKIAMDMGEISVNDSHFDEPCENSRLPEIGSERGEKREANFDESEENQKIYIKEEMDDQEEDLSVSDTFFQNDDNEENYFTNSPAEGKLDAKKETTSGISLNRNSNKKSSLQKSFCIDEYSAVGINVAAKLRKMNEKQAIHAEFLISQALCKGLLNELTENSSIVN